MVVPRKPLLPPYRHLYRQEPHGPAPDDLTPAEIAGRVGLTLLILGGATLLGVVLPMRHPVSMEARWLGSLTVGLLVAGGYFYTAVWRLLAGGAPAPASRWVGEFEVREKLSVAGTKLLRLVPGDNHTVRVGEQLFGLVRPGDWVWVLYSANYELVSVAKTSRPGSK